MQVGHVEDRLGRKVAVPGYGHFAELARWTWLYVELDERFPRLAVYVDAPRNSAARIAGFCQAPADRAFAPLVQGLIERFAGLQLHRVLDLLAVIVLERLVA